MLVTAYERLFARNQELEEEYDSLVRMLWSNSMPLLIEGCRRVRRGQGGGSHESDHDGATTIDNLMA